MVGPVNLTCDTCGLNHAGEFEGFRAGYHYTSGDLWRRIRTEGLVPYPLKTQLYTLVPEAEGRCGIWLWLHQQTALEHAGSVMFHATEKTATIVVVLRVLYRNEDIIIPGTDKILTTHHSMNDPPNDFWHRGTQAVIAWRRIHPMRIELLEEIDVVASLAPTPTLSRAAL